MRVNTIRQRAWLAWRLPPRLSRCRVVLPEEAWIGATPHRSAKAASEVIRSALSPAATSSNAAVCVPTPWRATRLGVHHAVTGRVGTQPDGGRRKGGDGDATEPFSQLIGSAEAEM